MDRLELMNRVLTKLGQDDDLQDPDADTRAGRALRAAWNGARDMALRAHYWNFATDPAGAQLTADGAYAPATYADHSHRFALPADCLRVDLQRLRPESLRRDVRVTRRHVYANSAGPIHIVYVAKVEEVGEWDALFAEAFTYHLAADTTDRITGGDPSADSLMEKFREAVRNAKSVDGRENPPEEVEETDWTTARHDAGAVQRFY